MEEQIIICPKCGNNENFHFNYDYSERDLAITELLCNECGEFFKIKNSKFEPIKYQENLFNDIIGMKHRIQILGSFVQNDFNEMLKDGTIIKENIKEGIDEMDESFNEVINMLNKLREKCQIIMKYYCE